MQPNNSEPQSVVPVSNDSTPSVTSSINRVEEILKIVAALLAVLFFLGILLPSAFGNYLILPLVAFALLAVKQFRDDTKKNATTVNKSVNIFKIFVKICMICLAIVGALVILLVVSLAGSGV